MKEEIKKQIIKSSLVVNFEEKSVNKKIINVNSKIPRDKKWTIFKPSKGYMYKTFEKNEKL